MEGNFNQKIVGSSIIGFALVAGAYVISNFNTSEVVQQAAVRATAPAAAPRVAIEVNDSDGNGIEDWRDDFVTTEAVILDEAVTTYEPPDTLTGKMGIDFMQNIILAKGYGPFGSSQEEIIDKTIDNLSQEAVYDLYDTPDVIIMSEWGDMDIVNYANSVAGTIMKNNVPNAKSEIVILKDLLVNEDTSRLTELKSLAEGYRLNRDDILNIPVPTFLVKEHLDLINTINAIHQDITAMTLAIDDPAITLISLKRYQEDAEGLGYAMQNMYLSLEPYASLFTINDPAALFVYFSPNFQN